MFKDINTILYNTNNFDNLLLNQTRIQGVNKDKLEELKVIYFSATNTILETDFAPMIPIIWNCYLTDARSVWGWNDDYYASIWGTMGLYSSYDITISGIKEDSIPTIVPKIILENPTSTDTKLDYSTAINFNHKYQYNSFSEELYMVCGLWFYRDTNYADSELYVNHILKPEYSFYPPFKSKLVLNIEGYRQYV